MTAIETVTTTTIITNGIIITGHTRIDIPMNIGTTGDITGAMGGIVTGITEGRILIVTGDLIVPVAIIGGIDTITDN